MRTRSRTLTGGVAASLSLIALSWSSSALADQFVVIDQTWVHTPDLPDSHQHFDPSARTPDNWVSPVDYSQGTAYVYLEVHTKPTAQETRFQVCFEATPTYACTDQSPTYTTVGTYEWSTPFSNFYQPEGTSVDWTQGVNKIACILKDTMNNKPSADNVGATEAALYTPTEVRMVVTIVTPGGTYVPPTPTGEGGAGGASASSSSGSSTSGASVSSSAAASTSEASSAATGGANSSGAGGAASASDGGSCAIGAGSSGSLGGASAILMALWLRKRRERRPSGVARAARTL